MKCDLEVSDSAVGRKTSRASLYRLRVACMHCFKKIVSALACSKYARCIVKEDLVRVIEVGSNFVFFQ